LLKSLHRSLECITLAKEINKLKHKTMKTLYNIWDLEQLSNHNLKEIAFQIDKILTSENTINYNYYNKADLVGSIYTTLIDECGEDMTEMIDYLIRLVKDGSMELTNH